MTGDRYHLVGWILCYSSAERGQICVESLLLISTPERTWAHTHTHTHTHEHALNIQLSSDEMTSAGET